MAGQKDLDESVQEFASRGVARADGLGASALAAAIKARGKDAGVVEDDKVVGMQQIGEVAEAVIGIQAVPAPKVQHAGGVALGRRFLSNQFVGKIEVEVGEQHRKKGIANGFRVI